MRVDVHGVGIEVQVEGGDERRAVVLLHGFPDSGRLWRDQTAALATAGFRVVVTDLRGYGGSDKPDDVAAYALPELVGDVLGVLDHLGIARAHVVGHDWGAALAWVVACLAPDRVDHLVALSVGHPTSFGNPGIEQLEKSWYMLLFQYQGIAERWLSDDGWANFRRWSRHPDADATVEALERDGSLTAGLAWYRANLRPERFVDGPMALPPVSAPTMGVWSSGDIALLEEQMTGSARYVTGEWRYERLEGPGHWMQLDAPQRVNELLLDFLPV